MRDVEDAQHPEDERQADRHEEKQRRIGKTVQKRQGLSIGAPEEIAWRNGWISTSALLEQAERLKKNQYGKYLIKIAGEKVHG